MFVPSLAQESRWDANSDELGMLSLERLVMAHRDAGLLLPP